MKILDMTLTFLSLFGVATLSAQSIDSGNQSGSFVEVDGSRLYYQECGAGPKAVILLHDGVVNSAVWDDVWPTLCKQFHVIRYDRRGYGRSPATRKPYYEADDVAAIIRDRRVSKAALVGSSHGGNIAMTVALRYPAQIGDLVLIGPEAEGFPYSEHFIKAHGVSRSQRSDRSEGKKQLFHCAWERCRARTSAKATQCFTPRSQAQRHAPSGETSLPICAQSSNANVDSHRLGRYRG